MKQLPNLLTGIRLVLSVLVFAALAVAGQTPSLSEAARALLEQAAFAAFVVAAVTDFFDGWLARRWKVVSVWGAILDPIADKVLICAAVIGLMALSPSLALTLPAGLILFREFAISALREVTAGKGVSLPVTLLAKWKTTIQLVALGAEMLVAGGAAFGLPAGPGRLHAALEVAANGLLWIAAAITLYTGAEYVAQARKALAAR
jgi:CDP-diacylglycerol--glycerol-3-phosphate 3-phosphatidyltransferase